MMKKIIFIAPHLSTGGLPQYLYKKMELLKNRLEVFCIEYENITGGVLVIQRNRITNLLDDQHFFSLGENKKDELIALINKIKPDYIHLEEIPEYFLPSDIADSIYVKERNYKIFETSHDSSFEPDKRKLYFPDAFFFVSNWQIEQYKNINIPKYLAEYPIEFKDRPNRGETLKSLGLDPNKKHILNVGLFTPRKNQAEIFDMSKHFGDDVEFHFLGNHADNFKFYWEPLLKNKPSNCKVWGERNDTDLFFSCMDLFLFTSRGNNGDKETMPLVLREAIGWKIPVFLYNLDVYQNYFDRFKQNDIEYLDNNLENNVIKIKTKLGIIKEKYFNVSFDRNENKISFSVIIEHKDYKKFNFRMRDKITGLKFQPSLNDIDFIKGFNYWCVPNSQPNYRNGLLIEFLNGDTLIEKYEFDDNEKTFWPPYLYPTTEIYYENKKIDLHSDPNDNSAYWSYYEVFIKQDYKNIEHGDVVLDIGANLGFFSLYAMKEGAKKVYAFEPIESTYSYLEKNVNKIDNIIALNLGIGSETKDEQFVISSNSSSIAKNSRINNEDFSSNENTERINVKLININEFIQQYQVDKIDYVKIDCEGGEIDFFNTIDKDFLKNKIRKISGEIHIGIIGSENHLKIINILKENDFIVEEDIINDLSIFYAYNKSEISLPRITLHDSEKIYSDDIAVIVQTCDAYEKFWDGWYKSMKRYWNWDLNWKIYFLTEEKDPYFVNDKRIEIIKIKEEDSRKGFSTRMMKALEKINKKYVFYFQEDMWLILNLDKKFLLDGLNMMQKYDWNCLRIQERLWGNISLNKTNYFLNDIRLLKYKNSSEWSLAHHPSIWNKQFLMDNLIENEDPWKNEILGTRRIYDKYTDTKIYHCNVRWYYQPGASQNGNMNPFMEEYLRNLNLTEDLNNKFDIYGKWNL